MSLHRLSGQAGYRYLLRSTVCGDGHRASGGDLASYYARSGTPAGRWWGAGLAGLSLDSPTPIQPRDAVSEEQLERLFGQGRHPVTGQQLGRSAPSAARVAGFDLTFTVPKSASVLWGVGNARVRAAVVAAHEAAVDELLGLVEQRALFTRVGPQGGMQVDTRGMLAARFDHWDSRHGDPNLHTHVIVANRVQGPDGRWRTVDSRALHQAAVALSEMFDDVFADQLAARLPVRWGWRSRGQRRTPAFEIDGISDELLATFSSRATAITAELARLREQFTTAHGRAPSRVEVVRLRQQATLATRPAKQTHPLPQLLARWADTTQRVTGRHPHLVTADALAGDPDQRLRSAQVDDATVDRLALLVGDGLLARRAVFTEWNIWAETARATRGLRMTATIERVRLVERVVAVVTRDCVALDRATPPHLSERLRRADGASVYTRAGEARYAHPRLLAAEQALLAAHGDHTAPTADPPSVDAALGHAHPNLPGVSWDDRLADDQAAAVRALAASPRRVDVLVGPAGAGKTTTLAALAAVWSQSHGPGSVIGLAPSASAAHQLGTALKVGTENTAKWLHESTGPGATARTARLADLRANRIGAVAAGDYAAVRRIDATTQHLHTQQQAWQLRAGQLVIVDEATLAGTLDLAELTRQATEAGAKLLLVGDHAQLGSVAAGGGFGMLARTGQPVQLTSLWRFSHPWEAHGTTRLRAGEPSVIDQYAAHDRLHAGNAEEMADACYQAWAHDRATGQSSIMIAPDTPAVEELNTRAHDQLVADGAVTGPFLTLGGPCSPDRGQVGVGDVIVTRRNSRHLTLPGGGHVRNGALWTVQAIQPDGTLTAHRLDSGQEQVRLPADYVAQHVELGYATTAHRAQGLTVDTSHTLATPATTRESLYVAMTRGRHANHAYLTAEPADTACSTGPVLSSLADPRELMAGILNTSGVELSATEAFAQGGAQRNGIPGVLEEAWPPTLHSALVGIR